VGCGRSGLFDPLEPAESPPTRPENAPPPNASPEPALHVFTGSACPGLGTEDDLVPVQHDGLALVRFRVAIECSGAGGEWLIGRVIDAPLDVFVGGHACYFLPDTMQEHGAEYFAVVRYSQMAALFHTPHGWCVTDADGKEPVTSAWRSIAWGAFRTESGARAALARLEATR
jgi:hypothetical protein